MREMTYKDKGSYESSPPCSRPQIVDISSTWSPCTGDKEFMSPIPFFFFFQFPLKGSQTWVESLLNSALLYRKNMEWMTPVSREIWCDLARYDVISYLARNDVTVAVYWGQSTGHLRRVWSREKWISREIKMIWSREKWISRKKWNDLARNDVISQEMMA